MKRFARWARQFGLARAVCVVLLFALVPLRVADPRPLEELRLRTFDLFQVSAPARADRAAGRHRRYRRSEPEGDRAMAVAADRGGRSGHPPARARRRGDRLRHRFRRARPHVAGGRGGKLSRPRRRRPATSSPAFPAMTRSWPTRSGRPASSSSARPARRRRSRARTPRWRCRPASPFAGPIHAVPGDVSRTAAQRSADRAGRGRPRPVLDQSRTRRHRPPRAGRHGSARDAWCRR